MKTKMIMVIMVMIKMAMEGSEGKFQKIRKIKWERVSSFKGERGWEIGSKTGRDPERKG